MEYKKENPRQTILVIVCGLLLLYFVYKQHALLYGAFSVALLAALSDFMALKIHLTWMALSKVMGYIVPNIVLSLLYYFLLTPVALLKRVFGKKGEFDCKKNDKSNFIVMNKGFQKGSFEKPW